MMRACRLVLEGRKEESQKVAQTFSTSTSTPKASTSQARVLARVDEARGEPRPARPHHREGVLLLVCHDADPWMDSIRGRSRFAEVVRRAEARTREAQQEFLRLNGDRLLALNA
jgi:hypothetical protein